MRPVITPAQMRKIDAEATVPVDVLIKRAGWVVADEARRVLGGTYGKRVAVLAGGGNNGADGRAAASVLEGWGARCALFDAASLPTRLDGVDLVIDACFGTGFRGTFAAPHVGTVPVLAVDIPSGIDGLTGMAAGTPLAAQLTVALAAAKPGNLIGDGAMYGGRLVVRDIGLEMPSDVTMMSERSDLRRWPQRSADHHKWKCPVWVIGGRAGGLGAPTLSAAAAARSGASYVLFSVPGCPDASGPTESVAVGVGTDIDERIRALVIGPGLPVTDEAAALVRRYVTGSGDRGVVLDAGAISAVAGDAELVRSSPGSVVLTPHDGEYQQLMGVPPGPDRLQAATDLASEFEAVVLLKGPATVVAAPDGRLVVSVAGDERLATAGSGDVLAGVIGGGMAQGLSAFDAAWLATELVGRSLGFARSAGLVAGDLPAHVAQCLASVHDGDLDDDEVSA